MMAGLRFTHALVCRVPEVLAVNAAIDLAEARKEHGEFCQVLRNIGLDVIELPADENFPFCAFIEDTAIVCNGTALICKPGLESRRKEVDTVRAIIKKELELPIVDIADDKAFVDGGDILFTGREFFVGLSDHTNDAGARAVAAAFPEYAVTPVKIPSGNHLKSLMSLAGPDIMCMSSSPESQIVLKRIAQEATYRYHMITVPNSEAANCLFINGNLVHRSEYLESAKVLEEKVDFNRIPVKLSELSKAKATLSGCCILLKKTKYIRKL